MLVLALILVAGAGFVWGRSRAAGTPASQVGYVDSQKLINAYLASPPVNKVLQAEKARLEKEMQAKIDQEKDANKKQEIVNQYQEQLNQRINQEVVKLNTYVTQVAKEQNIPVVLEGQAVLYGGVDLTEAVMKKAGLSQ